METLYYSVYASPVGPLLLTCSDHGLVSIHFHSTKPPRGKNTIWVEDAGKTAACRQQLEEYFAGKRREFTLPLDLRGTEFQLSCWNVLLEIPYGKTCTYADIARRIRKPNAFRAVGMANHDNPIPIIVPCHRVIGADGSLTGYGGGLPLKEKLLELEGAAWREQKSLFSRAG